MEIFKYASKYICIHILLGTFMLHHNIINLPEGNIKLSYSNHIAIFIDTSEEKKRKCIILFKNKLRIKQYPVFILTHVLFSIEKPNTTIMLTSTETR